MENAVNADPQITPASSAILNILLTQTQVDHTRAEFYLNQAFDALPPKPVIKNENLLKQIIAQVDMYVVFSCLPDWIVDVASTSIIHHRVDAVVHQVNAPGDNSRLNAFREKLQSENSPHRSDDVDTLSKVVRHIYF